MTQETDVTVQQPLVSYVSHVSCDEERLQIGRTNAIELFKLDLD